MTEAIGMLLLGAAILLGLASLFGCVQGVLTAKLNGRILRKIFLAFLPGICTLATLVCVWMCLTVTGWDLIGWWIYLALAASALVGTLVGRWFGLLRRRIRQKGAEIQKEGL
ncbi:MAG: hypothetical protein EOM52_07820 [Clostridia bacterium]|nr:hypothetical protein [Clostridia bacterium]